MALVNCMECGKEISNKADKCPNCGAGSSHAIGIPIAKRVLVSLLIFVFGASLFLFGLYQEQEKRAIENEPIVKTIYKNMSPAKAREYDDLVEQSLKHISYIKYSGLAIGFAFVLPLVIKTRRNEEL